MRTIADLHPLFHLGALASVVALGLRGQLQLRIMLLLGLCLYLADEAVGTSGPDWSAIAWNALFFAINLYVLVEMVLDRTTFGMSAEEKDVFSAFLSLSPGEFRALSRLGLWRTTDHSMTITTEDVVPVFLFYVYEGAIEITKAGRSITLEPRTFIGEVAFLRGSPASASATIAGGSRYIQWSAPQLHHYLERHSRMRVAFNRALSDDLALKVARS